VSVPKCLDKSASSLMSRQHCQLVPVNYSGGNISSYLAQFQFLPVSVATSLTTCYGTRARSYMLRHKLDITVHLLPM